MGKQSVKARIYYWDWQTKIVISDVDGTITKSDLFGQIMPIIGNDWSQPGIAALYDSISKNGYKLLYLSSRAIGLADITRGYLNRLKQEDIKLPKGPLIISHDRLAKSIQREVITKKPQKFKITALREIKRLFPQAWQPFVAGFGNRSTDLISYWAVGISPHRIFIVNTKGAVQVGFNNSCNKSYKLLAKDVDFLFPLLKNCNNKINNSEFR